MKLNLENQITCGDFYKASSNCQKNLNKLLNLKNNKI
jgi:hypothetical protein